MVTGSQLGSMGVCADGHQYRLVDAAPTLAAMLRVPTPRQVRTSGIVTSMRTNSDPGPGPDPDPRPEPDPSPNPNPHPDPNPHPSPDPSPEPDP